MGVTAWKRGNENLMSKAPNRASEIEERYKCVIFDMLKSREQVSRI